MQRLEKEENWEEIASQNPKAREDMRQRQSEQLQKQLADVQVRGGRMQSKFQ